VPAEIKNISVPGKFKAELKRWQDGRRIEMQRRNNAETLTTPATTTVAADILQVDRLAHEESHLKYK
jgi:hypothetical protein